MDSLWGDVLDHPVLDLHHLGRNGVGIAEDEVLIVERLLTDLRPARVGMGPGQDAAKRDLSQLPERQLLPDRQVLPKAQQDLDLVLEEEIEEGVVGDDLEEGVEGGDLLPAPVQDTAEEVQVGLALAADGQGLDPGVGMVPELGGGDLQLA